MTDALHEFADLPIWVTWTNETREGGKSTKTPYTPAGNRRASTINPATWNTRPIAERSAQVDGRDGIGIVLAPLDEGRHLGGVDLDSCLNDAGTVAPWAREIVELLSSYTEVSPSGHGLKVLFTHDERVTLAEGVRWRSAVRQPALKGGKEPGIEFYLRGRYFTVTYATFGQYDTIRAVDLDTLRHVQRLMDAFDQKPKAPTHHPRRHDDDDQQRLFDAITHIPNPDLHWNDWTRIGMAIYAETGGSAAGYAAFLGFSRKSSKFDPCACDERWQHWRTSPPDRLTAGTIIYEAKASGWQDPRQAKSSGATDFYQQSSGVSLNQNGDDPGREKPRLLVDPANPDLTVAALRDILRTYGGLYDRGVPVRLAFDQAQRGMVAQVLTPEVLVLSAHSVCRPYRVKKKADGPEEEDTRLPRDIATMYLDWKGEWKLPVLNGIASAPMLKDAGTIVATAGYDQASGMWCDDLPALGALVPEVPTKDEARAALALLRQTFRTFCFADADTVPDLDGGVAVVNQDRPIGHDESAMLSGLLTAVCRPSLDHAPAFLLRGSRISGAGTGKGLLARCMSQIAFGREPHAVTGGGNNEEIDKRIAAELMEGHPVLFLDNLNNAAFRSDLLASVITERPARVRVLGLSKMVQLNSSAFVVLTGNGLSVAEDLARRVITVELDAKTEDPETRPFKSNLRQEVLAKRPELLAALLTIWRWGRRTTLTPGKALGSFERWSRWVRDPLLALGCQDVVEQVRRAKERDAERQFVGELFHTWRDRHGDSPVAIRELHEDVRQILDPQGRGRQFVQANLRPLIGTRATGLILTRQAGSGKWSTATYALMLASDSVGHRDHRGHRTEGGTQSPPKHNGATPMAPMPPMTSPGADEADAKNPADGGASSACFEMKI